MATVSQRKHYTAEFRAEALVLLRDHSVRQAAEILDCPKSVLWRWQREEREAQDEKRAEMVSDDEKSELERLRRENRELREDVDLLKKATAFFASRKK